MLSWQLILEIFKAQSVQAYFSVGKAATFQTAFDHSYLQKILDRFRNLGNLVLQLLGISLINLHLKSK